MKILKESVDTKRLQLITVGELRALLFEVKNQNMTVQELRSKLFDLDFQDDEPVYKQIRTLR